MFKTVPDAYPPVPPLTTTNLSPALRYCPYAGSIVNAVPATENSIACDCKGATVNELV